MQKIILLNLVMNNSTDSHRTMICSTCLLLSVAEADEILEKKELDTICDILIDFFSITPYMASDLLHKSQEAMADSVGLFEFGQHLNSTFDKQDKLDFINCIFEVSYSDGNLHYLEHHTIKKIASILQISRKEIINSKKEIQNYLNK